MNSAHGPCASAARSRSNAISCSASSRSPSIRSSASSTTGPPPPDQEGFTPARRRKIHLAQAFCKKLERQKIFFKQSRSRHSPHAKTANGDKATTTGFGGRASNADRGGANGPYLGARFSGGLAGSAAL